MGRAAGRRKAAAAPTVPWTGWGSSSGSRAIRRIAQWACEESGVFSIRNPPQLKRPNQLIPVTNDIVQEFADMLATIAQAASDNVITKDEARDIRRRWEELKSVTEGFVHSAEDGNFRLGGTRSRRRKSRSLFHSLNRCCDHSLTIDRPCRQQSVG